LESEGLIYEKHLNISANLYWIGSFIFFGPHHFLKI